MAAEMSGGTTTLTAVAPGKLNLFLHVTGRRADGYHLLQSAFVLLDVCDTLHFSLRTDGAIHRASDLPGVREQDDLVVRAAKLLKREAQNAASASSFGVDIAIDKKLPMGAGLGGGSSDAATTLLALNRLWNLGFSNDRLRALGLTLGADVPFFLYGRSAFAEGVGEKLLPAELPCWHYLVLTPPVHVPTQAVFAHPELTRDTIPLRILDFSENNLADTRNDLQEVVLKTFPAVSRYLQALQSVSQKSIFGARMTGSGACVFAAFKSGQDARGALVSLQPEYKGFVAQGLSRHPFS
jgi:4-diphosphocytidyl-2-C-methyl-D-erythritol kinase